MWFSFLYHISREGFFIWQQRGVSCWPFKSFIDRFVCFKLYLYWLYYILWGALGSSEEEESVGYKFEQTNKGQQQNSAPTGMLPSACPDDTLGVHKLSCTTNWLVGKIIPKSGFIRGREKTCWKLTAHRRTQRTLLGRLEEPLHQWGYGLI